MKKIVYILSVALAAAACAKSEAPANNNNDINGNGPQAAETVVFSASSEAAPSGVSISPASKTSLSGSSVLWAQGDEIAILWDGGSTTAQAASAGATTSFSAVVDDADAYYAVYPSAAAGSLSGSALSVSIPSAQHGAFADANIAIAKTSDTSLEFKNLCALGKITLSRSDIAKVVFRGKAGENLAGSVTLSIDASGIPTVASTASPVDSIVLTPASGAAFAAGTYYFAAIPGTLSSGISFTLTTVSGNTILGKTSCNAAALNRSEARNFGTLDADGAPSTITVKFDFTGEALEGWPTEAIPSNELVAVDAMYPIDGTNYTFCMRYPSTTATTKYGVYWGSSEDGYGNRFIINGRYKYAGLPAISGYKLIKAVLWQTRIGATDKTNVPAVAISDEVPATNPSASSAMSLVSGGEAQAWEAGLPAETLAGPYTYNLSGTAAGMNYYLVVYYTSSWKCVAAGIGKIEVTYEKVSE
ncbi:MAG: hypothetical protein IJ686_00710 [Bacteroidales bacterium]|nr:hypothetical protein [Bacteroidales bacterium]